MRTRKTRTKKDQNLRRKKRGSPGNVVDVPPPVAVAQVQVTAVRRRHRHHRPIQVLVHQGQVRSLGLVLHRGLGSLSRNEGRAHERRMIRGRSHYHHLASEWLSWTQLMMEKVLLVCWHKDCHTTIRQRSHLRFLGVLQLFQQVLMQYPKYMIRTWSMSRGYADFWSRQRVILNMRRRCENSWKKRQGGKRSERH